MNKSANTVTIEEIKALLPHRYPFLMVDRVLAYEPFGHIDSIKNVTFNEPCFQGHFPSASIFPGVLIIEAMAQSAALLGALSLGERPSERTIYYLAGVDKVRFKNTVCPGDQLLLHAEYLKKKRNIWRFAVRASVADKFIASAELLTTTSGT